MNQFIGKLSGYRDPGDIKADLHIHTTASDGTWRPQKLVDNLIGAGIGLFAVTDHDTTENIAETAELAESRKLAFIPGVEINTSWNGRNYHILGMGIDAANSGLQELLAANRKMMDRCDDESIRFIQNDHPSVSFDEFARYCDDPERGGWKALNYIMDKKLCSSHKDYFKLFGNRGNPFDNIEFCAPKTAVKTIIQAGGRPVLAHPGVSFYDRDYKAVVNYMLQQGVKGIECYHPENSPYITDYCINLCRSEELLITGGSDCHGEFVKGRRLGYPDVRLSSLHLDGIWRI